MPSNLECLGFIFDRLKADAQLVMLVGGDASNIANHIPQDRSVEPGYVRARWDSVSEWDTKTSDGLEGDYIIDVWTERHGDKRVLEIFDRIYELLHNQPFTGGSSQSLLLRFENSNIFVEPDGVTHHGVMNFRHIYTN